ncbi:D-xylose 1-dehydrogenase [Aureococcus anophagefferens]|uniref:D-xylose 1-dehydrogenase (NADP(+), D-xylono-1,5-lactone-forming) n=1 Tax=Aureococcus anophagefferens TaxID=44056 RepID=A0ABR1FGL4_AURAN
MPAPIVGRAIRWGIMGSGRIASDMTRVLTQLPNTEVVAAGSRSAETAELFAGRFGIPKAHGSYAALAADADCDVVYVATPSMRHVQDSIMCLEAAACGALREGHGAVRRATRVLNVAREKELFFLHGDDGAGQASATLETGIYCAQFLQWAMDGDAPESIEGVVAELHKESGLDQPRRALLRFPGNRVGTLECSLKNPTARVGVVNGTKGVIRVPFPFWCPAGVLPPAHVGPRVPGLWAETKRSFPLPDIEGDFNYVNSQGLAYQAEEVNRCLAEGLARDAQVRPRECFSVMQVALRHPQPCGGGDEAIQAAKDKKTIQGSGYSCERDAGGAAAAGARIK